MRIAGGLLLRPLDPDGCNIEEGLGTRAMSTMDLAQEARDNKTYPMERPMHFYVGWYGEGGLDCLANDGRHGELEGVHRGEGGGEAQENMVDRERIYVPTGCHTTKNDLWAPSIVCRGRPLASHQPGRLPVCARLAHQPGTLSPLASASYSPPAYLVSCTQHMGCLLSYQYVNLASMRR